MLIRRSLQLINNTSVFYLAEREFCGTTFYLCQSRPHEAAKTLTPVIGLEIHAQISSSSKLFSGAHNKFMAPQNSLVANFDASIPGTLPILNKECVKAAVKTALALNCKINMKSQFDRKHYFYADTPQGYQITQQRSPIATTGIFCYPSCEGKQTKSVRIHQIQLEQDSGKSMHDDISNNTLIDLNRANVGLMEIVTAPDLTDAMDTCAFVKELQMTLKQINTCQGKMAEGQFRVDANISLSTGDGELGIRTEVKNISGLRALENAIDFEIKRQKEVIEEGGKVEKETRAYDDITGKTVSMREKEESHDYRFMPEPNLPPLMLYTDNSISSNSDGVNVDELRRTLPLLPSQLRAVLTEQHKLKYGEAEFLLEKELALYYHQVMQHAGTLSPLLVYNWMRTQLVFLQLKGKFIPDESKVTPEQLAELLTLQEKKEIDQTISKQSFEVSLEDGRSPTQVAIDNQWIKIKDPELVEELCRKALSGLSEETLANYNPKKSNKTAIRRLLSLADDACDGRLNKAFASRIARKVLAAEMRKR